MIPIYGFTPVIADLRIPNVEALVIENYTPIKIYNSFIIVSEVKNNATAVSLWLYPQRNFNMTGDKLMLQCWTDL